MLKNTYKVSLKEIRELIEKETSIGYLNPITKRLESIVVGSVVIADDICTKSLVRYIYGNNPDITKELLADYSNMFCEFEISKEAAEHVVKSNVFDEEIARLITLQDASILDSSSMFSKEFLRNRKMINSIYNTVSKLDGKRMKYYDESTYKKIESFIKEGLTEHMNGVYSFPLFSKEYCEKLVNEFTEAEYIPNLEEPYAAQIPEVTLKDRVPDLFALVEEMFMDIVCKLSLVLYGVEPSTLHTAQLAKYDVGNTSMGNWHIDQDSDVTLTIALSDSHEGGGTVIKPYGSLQEVLVPQLPVGHGLLFRGKNYLHKGLPVTKGTRNLLVFWSEL
jgi:hypothetical protein